MLIKVRQTPSDIIGKCRVIRDKYKKVVKIYKILDLDVINETVKIEMINLYCPSIATGTFKFWNGWIMKLDAPIKEQLENKSIISLSKFDEII